MNSDPWREIWLEQPVAPTPAAPDQLLAEVRAEAEAWEAESARGERHAFLSMFGLGLYFTVNFWTDPEPFWSQGIALASLLVWTGMSVVVSGRRRALERQFGTSVADRLARMRAMLRQRLRWSSLSLYLVVPMAAAFGMMPIEMADAAPWVGVLVGLLALGWLGWWFQIEWTRERARLQQRLAVVEAACASFARTEAP